MNLAQISRHPSLFPRHTGSHFIAPLFWQHGETADILREEMRRMRAGGCDGCIVESRPFPQFLEQPWWDTLDLIIGEARTLGMKVWIFDDKAFPSGYANGLAARDPARYGKQFLREEHVDAVGPRPGASFFVRPWLAPGETLYAAVAGLRTDFTVDCVAPETLTDLTAQAVDGRLYWDVPPGRWRVYWIIRASKGGEDWTEGHINPIEPAAVGAFIEEVYEPHYRRYKAEFGKTIAGFFNDEPRFGNAKTYDGRIGHYAMPLPFSSQLKARLDEAWGGDFTPAWPALWADAGAVSRRARLVYMDVITRLYETNFSRRIGDWCQNHGVRWIGHAIEDSGAHARLGWGSGHFFRALAGQHASGFDSVYQIWPDYKDGRTPSPFGSLDSRFFYWGMAKLASSAGHLEPRKQGITVCEVFGAYGWQFGLRMMKWLTDHVVVRGANFLIPHAFSPKDFPDGDNPPHFYARGHNPQWRHFSVWGAYAQRLCRLFTGGQHVAPALVLYHAEAEWAGDYEPFEALVRPLAERQVDCDIVSADLLHGATLEARAGAASRVRVHTEQFDVVLVPYAQLLPAATLQTLARLSVGGARVIFQREFPQAAVDDCAAGAMALAQLRRTAEAIPTDALASALNLGEVILEPPSLEVRAYHYHNVDRDLYFLVNEGIREAAEFTACFPAQAGTAAIYDALEDRLESAAPPPPTATSSDLPGARIALRLEPFASRVVVFSDDLPALGPLAAPRPERQRELLALTGPWQVETATAEEYPAFTPAPAAAQALGNAAAPGLLPEFSGTLRYSCAFAVAEFQGPALLDLGLVHEIAQVRVNGRDLGVRICPPYRFELGAALRPGVNEVVVEVTNTLAKAHGQNNWDRFMPQEPSGLLGPVRVLVAEREALV